MNVEPLAIARELKNSIAGTGDDVVRLTSGDILDFTHDGSSNFAVWAFSLDGDADLIINEIGNYVGTHAVPGWVDYLEIVADGNWTIE